MSCLKMKRLLWTTFVLICACAPAVVSAQTTAAIRGTVSDETGALLPGVEVTARNVNTGIETLRISNETGTYTVPSLQPGTYNLSASLPGFQNSSFEGIVLSAGQDVRYNFTLRVGGVTETIEVVSQADAELRTTSASVGDVLPENEVTSLPTFSRNVLDLAQLIPGAVVEGTFSQNYGGTRQSQINTTRDGLPTGDGRYLDWNGVYSATFTSPDLVEEVQVNVTTADAAMGRGSGQVRMQTRSGTNEYHGALFYQNNNAALNANDWFSNTQNAEKEYENRNQFGGRIGGPIFRNKAFFFVLYDGQRYADRQEVVSTVLTDQARQGIFRYLTEGDTAANGGTVRQNGNTNSLNPSVDANGNVLTADPGDSTPLFLNQFDVFSDVNDPFRTAIDQTWIASQYLPRMPLPNDFTVGDGLNTAGYRWNRRQLGLDGATGTTQTTNRDHLTVRIDYQLDDDNRITYSMTREDNWGVTGQTGLPSYPTELVDLPGGGQAAGGYFGAVTRQPDVYSAQWNSTVSASLLNEFRWGLKRDVWFGEAPPDVGCCRDRRNYVTTNLTDLSAEAAASFPQVAGNLMYVDPGLGLGDYAPLGVATPRGSVSPLMQFADNVSWTQGAHSLQAGFEITRTATDQFNHGGDEMTRPRVSLGVGSVPITALETVFPALNSTDAGNAENLLANLAGSVSSLDHQYFINQAGATAFSDYTDGLLFYRNFHENDWAAFIKDTWSVTPGLSVTLGLRYDVYGVPYEQSGLALGPQGGEAGLFGISGTGFNDMFTPGASNGALTIFDYAGKNSPNSSTPLYNNDYNNFAPSVGFSWNVPWFDRPTVLRGGYGVSYTGAPTYLQYSSIIGGAPGSALPVSQSPAQANPGTNYVDIATAGSFFPLSNGGIAPLEPVPLTNRTTNIQGYADDRPIPYVQSFNLSIQREIFEDTTLEVAYVGSKGTKLHSGQQLNITNIYENGILQAFLTTQAGGDAALFDQILDGIDLGAGVGTVGVDINPATGNPWTGSEAFRAFGTTDQWFANGEVGDFASWLDENALVNGEPGGMLRFNGFPDNFIKVNPQFGSVTLHGNNDNSSYHSLQTQVTRRLSNGFTGTFSYVWSKNLGNSGAGNAFASDTSTGVRDPRNYGLQYGLVAGHRTHNFKAHAVYNLPFGPGQAYASGGPSWVSRLVEGWELSGIFNWTSGAPLTFNSGLDTNNAESNSTTPDQVGEFPSNMTGVVIEDTGPGVVSYFTGLSVQNATNTTGISGFTNKQIVDGNGNVVMQNPAPGTTGNMSLNFGHIEGPARLGLDMGLSKTVQIDEARTFTIRADAINVLNTPIWNDPNVNINSNSFGRITSASGNRTITINARLDF
jgi:Carboxypeptidase regulatory-like domain